MLFCFFRRAKHCMHPLHYVALCKGSCLVTRTCEGNIHEIVVQSRWIIQLWSMNDFWQSGFWGAHLEQESTPCHPWASPRLVGASRAVISKQFIPSTSLKYLRVYSTGALGSDFPRLWTSTPVDPEYLSLDPGHQHPKSTLPITTLWSIYVARRHKEIQNMLQDITDILKIVVSTTLELWYHSAISCCIHSCSHFFQVSSCTLGR